MNLIYNKTSGKILRYVDKEQNPLDIYYHYTEEYKSNIGWIEIEKSNIPIYRDCYIKDGKITSFTETELMEKLKYGRTLTKEEQINILLMPSPQEIQKAQNTIEILSLLQEVNLI